MFKRFGLFIVVNFAIMMTLMVITNLLGIRHYLTPMGIDYQSLMAFCLVWGMGGAFISLLISKKMAKWTMGLKIIDPSQATGVEQRLHSMVDRLAKSAGLPKVPEVALYESPEVNAFATGPSRSNSLVAVSTGLLRSMQEGEVEGVLAHEVSHIANGDMVTMTLLQGVLNAFVMFFAKAIAWAVGNALSNSDEDSGPSYFVVFAVEMALYIVFGILAGVVVNWFSRKREFSADKGAANLAGTQKMVAALERLKSSVGGPVDSRGGEGMLSMKISAKDSWSKLFSTHPSLEDRITALRGY